MLKTKAALSWRVAVHAGGWAGQSGLAPRPSCLSVLRYAHGRGPAGSLLLLEGMRKIRGLAFEAGSAKADSQGMGKQRGHRYF